ncbi:MAG: hypothetical protein EOP02_24355 [Proteobacteria bacterium]|nr:MAG: hypothetical protein EOP02_24355 [Pseudomonadota bacterium]
MQANPFVYREKFTIHYTSRKVDYGHIPAYTILENQGEKAVEIKHSTGSPRDSHEDALRAAAQAAISWLDANRAHS